MDELFFSIYEDLMDVTCQPGAPFPVENLFEEGKPCDVLYHELYDCKLRLLDRLQMDEDHDLEVIMDNFFKMIEIVSKKMFEYGIYLKDTHL